MRKLIVLLFVMNVAYGQVYQRQPWYGLQVARLLPDSVLYLPLDTARVRDNISRVGQVRWNRADSSLYVNSGTQWIKVSGSGGGGGSQTWEQTLQQGATATTLPIISRSFLGQSLRFVNPANSNEVNFVMGSGSVSNRTLTMPTRSGRLATWSQRIECVNDSLFAYDEGVRYWTGELCDDSVGTSNVIAGNQMVKSGDTLGLRSTSPGSGNGLWFDPVKGSLAAGSAGNVASGVAAVAMGIGSTASGDASLSVGDASTASGVASVAMGAASTASGGRSFAFGFEDNRAEGEGSVVMGHTGNVASGVGSVAMGYFGNTASGLGAFALGNGVISKNDFAFVVGNRNDTTNQILNDVRFQVANGGDLGRSTAFEVRGNGQLLINDGTQQAGYVLTSDANGVTSWQPASGGSPTWGSITGTLYDQTDLRDTLANRIITGSDASLRSLHITGTNGNGKLELRHQASLPTAGGQTTSLYANSNGNLAWKNDNLSHTTLATNHITADRSYRFQDKSYTLADSADVLNRADSTLYTTPHDLNVKTDSILSLDDDGIALTTLGMSAKFISANRKFYQLTSSLVLTNGFYQGIYFTVKAPTTFTGARWLQVNVGNYTAGTGFNGIGLYRYNSTTDSLELLRETANEPDIWQRASSTNSWQSAAFTSPVTVQPGVYYIGWSYNNSAQTTAPTIGAGQALQTGMQNLPNGKRLHFVRSTSTPSLPSRIGWGSTQQTSGTPFILIY